MSSLRLQPKSRCKKRKVEIHSMRALLLTAGVMFCVATLAAAQVSINRSQTGWVLTNGHIRVELTHSSDTVLIKSLRCDAGAEWAVVDKPIVAVPQTSGNVYRYLEDAIS